MLPEIPPLAALAIWLSDPEVVEALDPLFDGLLNVVSFEALAEPLEPAAAISPEPAVLEESFELLELFPEAPKVDPAVLELLAVSDPLTASAPVVVCVIPEAAFTEELSVSEALLLEPSVAVKLLPSL